MTSGPPAPVTPVQQAQAIRDQLPPHGLFHQLDWRTAPEPLALDPTTSETIRNLGKILHQFYRACNLLYRHSVTGQQPPWIAHWLELGKPRNIIELQRANPLKNELPRVIRPDLLLCENGLRITELDSVPGGIGLTAWLNQTYSSLHHQVAGGPNGMLDGFASIFPPNTPIEILVSEESQTYRPEMEWLSQQLSNRGIPCSVHNTGIRNPQPGTAFYRFFELFDIPNLPIAQTLLTATLSKSISLTPPPRSFLEEKMLLGLLWNRRLENYWRQELGTHYFKQLLSLTPRTWILDPSPLPPHAAIPDLNLSDWSELKELSQKDRQLILKISGFSPQAWGARGVYLGSDLPAKDWAQAVHQALSQFPTSPSILQRFEKPKRIPCSWVNFTTHTLLQDHGRTRLCPYYFVSGPNQNPQVSHGGTLATICPADKKIIHGMSDAILCPTSP